MPVTKTKMTKKEFFLDYLLTIVLELVVLFGLMAFCSLFIGRGALLGTPELVGDELSSPTLGRLVYMLLSFILAFVLTVLASSFAKKDRDVPAFWCGFAAGILLWQAVGEEAWHFTVGGIHFV